MKLLSYRTASAGILLIVGLIFGTQYACAEPVPAGESGIGGERQPQMQEINDALARFKDRDLDGTLKLLEAAVKKNPDLPPSYVLLAQIYGQANMAQGVLQALETGIQKYPDDPEAYVILAQLALHDRRVTEAELLLSKASALLPKLDKNPKRKEILAPAIVSGLAQVYQAREDWATAKKYLDQWLKLDPKNAQALQQLASVLFKQKDVDGALAKLKEAKAIDAKVLTPEAILALYYQQSGETDKEKKENKDNAKKWMATALTKAPDDLDTLLYAAQLSLANGQLEDAQNRAVSALRINPSSLDAKKIRGVVALFQKDYRGAESNFESAHLKSPDDFAAKNNLAIALVEQKDESKKRSALGYAADNMQQYQKSANSVEAASTYGWVLYKTNKLDDADKFLQGAIQASGGNPPQDTAYYAARVASEKNRKEEAKTLLKYALKNPTPFTMRQEAAALLEELNKEQ
ncbi:MAG: tetratricopeptide repeat protein [Thermoguttaceae bacterium]|jgi:tetratricopeptide (TPR) repeat protein